MKSENWLIVEFGAALLILALLAFFYQPQYEKAVWFIIGAFTTQLGNVVGYKFGKSMPEQKGDPKTGQASKSETTTTTSTATPENVHPVDIVEPPPQ